MSNKLNEKPTSTSQPDSLIAIIAGAVKQLTWAGLVALLDITWARKASPALTGNPTAPTQAAGDNSTRIATTAYADHSAAVAVNAIVNSAPDALNTLKELADALGDDANYAASVTTALAGKAAASHAARHKSGGADAIKLDELAAPTDVTTLDATTTAHGLMSKADKVKLNGIASNANNYTLPAPGTGTLGGVMRNTGAGGQFVSGIGGDGALQFATPAGGGIIVRASAMLQGSASADIPAAPPAPLIIQFNGIPSSGDTWILVLNGSNTNFTWATTDPGDGSVWVNVNYVGTPDDAANALVAAINSSGIPHLSVAAIGSGQASISFLLTGGGASISAYINYEYNPTNTYFYGGGTGTDDIPPGGQISWARLFGNVSGKILRPLAVWGVSADLGLPVNIIDDYDSNHIVPSLVETGGVLVSLMPDISTIGKFMGACKGNIYAYLDSTASGGAATVYMIAELIEVPAYGTFQYYTCVGFSYVAIYADGAGSFYNVTIEANSGSCGFGS